MSPLTNDEHQQLKDAQKKISKYYSEMVEAKARYYDLKHVNDPKPTEQELKARVVYLESELAKAIAKRDQWKKIANKEDNFGNK